jgi:hypothetical protein
VSEISAHACWRCPGAASGSSATLACELRKLSVQAHGATCGYDYLCVAKPGYDAPTGLGTPDGTGAF